MKAETLKIDMELFGAEFANMDSGEQALFFHGLACELSTWESAYQRQMQFASVSSGLTANDKKELQNALEILWYEEAKK